MLEKILEKYLQVMTFAVGLGILYFSYWIYNNPSYMENMRKSKKFFEIIYDNLGNNGIFIFCLVVGIIITLVGLKGIFSKD